MEININFILLIVIKQLTVPLYPHGSASKQELVMPAERRDLIELLTCFFEKNHVKINFIIVVVHNIQKLSAWKLNY